MIDLKALRAGHAGRMSALHKQAFDAKMALMDAERAAYDEAAASRQANRAGHADIVVPAADDPGAFSDLIGSLDAAAARARVIVLHFPKDGLADAGAAGRTALTELVVLLANLALHRQAITLACIPGAIGGALLEVALRCDVLAVTPDARVTLSLTGAHGPGIYAALAERIGFVGAEKCFRKASLSGTELFDHGVAFYSTAACSFDEIRDQTLKKASTLVSLFGASRLSFPVSEATVTLLHGA